MTLLNLWTAGSRRYVVAVVDFFLRRVVGWLMHDTMTTQLVTDVLVMAIWRQSKPGAVLQHSDWGRGTPVRLFKDS